MNFFELMNQIGEMWKTGEIKETTDPKNNDLSIFHFAPNGMIYAANPKKKKQARATIALPSDVCGECISDLWDWEIKIIAIKRDKLKIAIEEYKKENKASVAEDVKRCLSGDVPQTEELRELMYKWQREAISEHEEMKSYNE